jgi:hypothetical protein
MVGPNLAVSTYIINKALNEFAGIRVEVPDAFNKLFAIDKIRII